MGNFRYVHSREASKWLGLAGWRLSVVHYMLAVTLQTCPVVGEGLRWLDPLILGTSEGLLGGVSSLTPTSIPERWRLLCFHGCIPLSLNVFVEMGYVIEYGR